MVNHKIDSAPLPDTAQIILQIERLFSVRSTKTSNADHDGWYHRNPSQHNFNLYLLSLLIDDLSDSKLTIDAYYQLDNLLSSPSFYREALFNDSLSDLDKFISILVEQIERVLDSDIATQERYENLLNFEKLEKLFPRTVEQYKEELRMTISYLEETYDLIK